MTSALEFEVQGSRHSTGDMPFTRASARVTYFGCYLLGFTPTR